MPRTPRSLARLLRGLSLTAVALCALPAAATAAPSAAELTIDPSSHDWGQVEVDRGYQQANFNIQNVSDDQWADIRFRIEGADAGYFWIDWNGCDFTLSPWSNCNVSVAFEPRDARDYDAELVVDAGENVYTVALTGSGGVRRVTASPQPLEFGSVEIGQSAARTATLQNTGNLYFQSMVAVPVGGDVGAFRVVQDGCSMQILAPGLSCQLKILFTPYEVDNAEATIAIIGEGEPALVRVRGVGAAAATATAPPLAGAATKSTGSDAGARDDAAPEKARRTARVAFNWRRGLPAPFRNGRVDLGIARCVAAPGCDARVRAWFVTDGARGAQGLRASKPRAVKWRIVGGRRAGIRVPKGLLGMPKRLIVDVRTSAKGQATGIQRLNIPLVEGVRRRGAVVATPKG